MRLLKFFIISIIIMIFPAVLEKMPYLLVKCGRAGLERMKLVGEKRRSERLRMGEKLEEGPEALEARREWLPLE